MRITRLLIGLCIVPTLLPGQGTYAPTTDTLFYLLVNPYRMYWVRNGDTLAEPAHAVSVEAEHWQRAGQDFRVTSRQLELNVHRKVKTDTLALTPLGVVRTINGHPPGMNERVDFVPRLPGRPLAAGLSWSDTLTSAQATGPIPRSYTVTRVWRVDRVFDSAGTRIASVSGTGSVHYADGWWVDSAAGRFASVDVRGPVSDQLLLAVNQTRVLGRSWSMNLTGQGILPTATGADTTPAGLVSSQTQRLITPDRAHLLTRALPGADTSLSYTQSPILLHVVNRAPAAIESAMTRNDGLVGTSRARFAQGRVVSFDGVWTDTAVAARRFHIAVAGDSLKIEESGRADTTTAIPVPWWGIADYAMNELLAPVLLSRAADTTTGLIPFAIYRPYGRHWDIGVAALQRYGDNFVASYRLGKDTAATVLLFTPDGDLLLGENSDPTGARRLPSPGSARYALLERILSASKQAP